MLVHIFSLGDSMEKKRRWLIALLCVIGLAAAIRTQAKTQPEAQPLSGVTVVVDPGHGGKDDGASSGEVKEQDINLAIALKLRTELEKAGAAVILTRDGRYDLASAGAKNRKHEDMEKRVSMINAEPSDLFISIHLNTYPNVGIHGGQVFYRQNDEAGKQLAQIIQQRLNALTKTEKQSKTGDYFILNESERPGVLVECGFLSNAGDREALMRSAYQQQLAELLTDSVAEYLQFFTL